MATVTLAFDPKVDAYESVVSVVNAAYSEGQPKSVAAEGSTSVEEPSLPNGWTRKRLRKYLLHLTENGLAAMRIIAEGAPTITFNTVQAKVGITDPSKYGGMMSTFGHAVNGTPGVTERPFHINYSTRTYEMDETLAALTVELLDEMGY